MSQKTFATAASTCQQGCPGQDSCDGMAHCTVLPEGVGEGDVVMAHERAPQRLQHCPVQRCKGHVLRQACAHACQRSQASAVGHAAYP